MRHHEQGRGDSKVIGPDLGWQLTDQRRLRGECLHSRTTAQAVKGELQRGAELDGNRLRLRAVRNTGAGETDIGIDDISSGIRHDTGFANQADVRRLEAFHSVGWRGGRPFDNFFIDVDAFQRRDRITGALVQEVLRPGLHTNAERNLEW